ncbi:hypothetical protein CEXT_66291 [Caerostris extrusa]|uniref:Uncharacterized protein n=1 Tax=Caerostris extrusa TaxID=172846 RepID=A0AAV4WG20_CAEEX|nr:hypothetical protein CEXT_66291 [Caerostris extrusa]
MQNLRNKQNNLFNTYFRQLYYNTVIYKIAFPRPSPRGAARPRPSFPTPSPTGAPRSPVPIARGAPAIPCPATSPLARFRFRRSPVGEDSVSDDSVGDKSIGDESITDESVGDDSISDESVGDKSVSDQSVGESDGCDGANGCSRSDMVDGGPLGRHGGHCRGGDQSLAETEGPAARTGAPNPKGPTRRRGLQPMQRRR